MKRVSFGDFRCDFGSVGKLMSRHCIACLGCAIQHGNIANRINARVWCYALEPGGAAERREPRLRGGDIATIAHMACLGCAIQRSNICDIANRTNANSIPDEANTERFVESRPSLFPLSGRRLSRAKTKMAIQH